MKEPLRLKLLKDVLWALALSALVVGTGRFIFGLAAATNMTDLLPWGLWKILNMIAGAAVATSGFIIAAVVYILNLEKFKKVARFSILIGFLGYGSSLFSLLFDIGLPHRGWHPFFMWNPHSFLFEVFWCVSVYWAITALEIIPLITERFRIPRITHLLHEYMLPFIVLGVTLSTMHHSSLGSLFMASPTRLHPLWFSLWIPVEFLISAMGAGMATIVLLMITFNWLYKRENDMVILRKILSLSAVFLFLYLALKTADFTYFNKWNFVFGPEYTWESTLFQLEMALQVIFPLFIFSIPKLRRNMGFLIAGCLSAFIGLGMHRINTGIVGYFTSSQSIYVPSLSEFVLSFGIIAATTLVFMFLVEKFYVFDEPEHIEGSDIHEAKVAYWSIDEAKSFFSGPRLKRVLLTIVIIIPLTAFSLRQQATGPYLPDTTLVERAPVAMDNMRTWLRIDANRNGDLVYFPHEKHMEELKKQFSIEKEDTCQKCHHLNAPKDHNSSCRVCHKDMEIPSPIFNMENHRDRFESEKQYNEFMALNLDIPTENYQACSECHEEDMNGLTDYKAKGFTDIAPGFEDAMHGLCLTCHRQIEEKPEDPEGKGNCRFCHKLNPVDLVELMRPDEPEADQSLEPSEGIEKDNTSL